MYSSWYEYLYYYWWYHQQQLQDAQYWTDLETGNTYSFNAMNLHSGYTEPEPMEIETSEEGSIELLQEIKQELNSISEKFTSIYSKLNLANFH